MVFERISRKLDTSITHRLSSHEILNAAGPRTAADRSIYGLVTGILELVFTLTTAQTAKPGPPNNVNKIDESKSTGQPKTVDEGVNFLIPKLSLKDKSAIAKTSEDDLGYLHFSFGLYTRNRLLYPGNETLLETCRQAAKDKYLHWDQAPAVIIKRIWEELKKSHKLSVVD